MTNPSPTPAAGTPLAPPLAPGASAGEGDGRKGSEQLSKDLADFLIELSIALHKHAIYPAGHPLLNLAVDGVTNRLWGLLADRNTLSIGIARRQLVIEGVATDAKHPLLHELAGKLHRHHLGAVKFTKGVSREELADALATVGVDSQRTETPLGLELANEESRWPSIRFFPLTYEKLELLDEEGDEGVVQNENKMRAGRAAQLWVGLARAALASDTLNEDDESPLEPVVVAKAIDDHQRETAYDQVIVGYLLQIADELKAARTSETGALQRRISRLVGALSPGTLKELLSMGGERGQRRRFVLDASQGMNVDAVVDLVKAAAEAEKQTISSSMLRLFGKLARHAGHDTGERQLRADNGLREQVTQLITEWSLDDPNPDAYTAVLKEMSRTTVGEVNTVMSMVCEPERTVQMALEVGTFGDRVWKAVGDMEDSGRLQQLLDIMDAAPNPDHARLIADYLWAERRALRRTLEEGLASRMDFTLVERLVGWRGYSAAAPLIDAIESANDAKTRERLLDILFTLGDAMAGLVARRLDAARPAQLRELLAFIGRFPETPPGFDPRDFLAHGESAVRREAVKLLLKNPVSRDETMVQALQDPDERTVFLALQAALERSTPRALALMTQRVEREELDPALRALAIRAVGASRSSNSKLWLIEQCSTVTQLLKRRKLRPATPEVMAALGALASYWPDDKQVKPLLELARRSKDPDIRQAMLNPRAPQAERYTTAVRMVEEPA